MGAPLGFKRRVQLPDALPEAPMVKPDYSLRRTILGAGLLAWLVVTVLGLGLHLGWFGAPERPQSPADVSRRPPPPEPTHGDLPKTAASIAPLTSSEPSGDVDNKSGATTVALPSCEILLPTLGPDVSLGGELPRDLTASGYGALVDQTYAQRAFGHCAQRPVQLDLCVVLQGGGPIAATIHTTPRDPTTEACITAVLLTLPYRFHDTPFLLRSRPWLVPSH